MSVKDLLDNINDDKFSDARSELSDFVQANVTDRVAAKQEELGLVIPVEEADTGAGEED